MERVVFILFVFLYGHCYGQTPDLVLRTPEEVGRGTYIGNVSDIKEMFDNVSPSEKQTLKFGILKKDSHPANLFRVEESTGKLYVEGRLDREALCDYTDSCHVEFDVTVQSTSTSSTFSNVATIHVYVDDINDNSPTFPASEVTLNVSELASDGAVLKISGAVDRDALPNNTIQTYELSRHQDLFKLTTTRNLDGSSVINLLLQKVLDHETIKQYKFNIVALDGGKPQRSGVLAVTINVIDENDNPPRFLNKTYTVVVKEDAPLNSTVLVVTATDPDLGKNGRVRYQFSNLQSTKMQTLFSIDSISGEIRVSGKLEYDNKPHQLIVEALDSGDTPLKTQTVITVTVLDSGNNRPVVKVNSLTQGSTVPESSVRGYFVAVVEVDDSDTGENGDVDCRISTTAFALEPLSGKNRYKVLVNTDLDREHKKLYNMSVTCQDRGTPPMTGTAVFQMHVTDVNDNAPVFQRQNYTVYIPENSAIGYSVVTLAADDADSDQNARMRYYVVENNPEKPSFRIQHETGIITTNRRFDREVEPLIKFYVLAIDQGTPAMTGTALVTLHVTDVNDMFPVFTHQLFQFRIRENLNASTIVGNITADDKDAGLNGEIEYFIAESPDGIIPFKVLPNGTVIAKESLDREFQSRYIFTVLARDKGSPPKTNSSEVSITVLDENDNIPSILFPTTYNHTVFISKPPETDTVIGKIVAYDPDFGENSTLNFVISAGNVDNAFSIDKVTGETKIANVFRLQNEKVYDLTITVHDSGTPQLKTETHLIIDVEFDNDTSLLAPVPQRSDKYVVIAAVVASATIILSIIIIAAICFVLKTDRRKPPPSSSMVGAKLSDPGFAVKAPVVNLESVALSQSDNVDGGKTTSQSGVLNNPQKPTKPVEHPYKKKEVSFSIDENMDSKPRDLIFSNSRLAFLDEKDKILHLDDVHSDTSGETIPSDSGRGGSEEEVNIQPDKKGHLNRWGAPAHGNKNHSFDPCFPSPRQQNADFRNSKNQIRFLHTNSFHDGRDFTRKPGVGDSSRDYLFRQGHNTFQDRSHEYSRPLSYRRQSSNMSHEDDGSTTTSGSYTINQDDFTVEDRILGKDVIV